MIRDGFYLKFTRHPPTTRRGRDLPASQDLSAAIAKLWDKRAIELVSDNCPGFFSPLFTIPKRDGGVRPVFNLRKLNEFIHAPHFKMETMTQVLNLVHLGDFMTSIDLSDAFLHIKMHQHSRKYLRFRWNNRTYQFRTAPFGLSIVPWFFTRLTKPILKWARERGIRVSAYLDDWIVLASSYQQARDHTQQLMNMLTSLGWLINTKKSVSEPTQVIQHLGFSMDTRQMNVKIPGKKLRDLRKSIQSILMMPMQTPRTIHSLTMRIRATALAVFPTRLYTQKLMHFKNQYVQSPRQWDQPQSLPPDCLDELRWWHRNISTWNGLSWIQPKPTCTLFVDASDEGWGAVLDQMTIQQRWTADEKTHSINWRELQAVFQAIRAFPQLRNVSILIRTDNISAMTYINKQGGTRSLPLSDLAGRLWRFCLRKRIRLTAQHIPGIENSAADRASRFFQKLPSWQLTPATFQLIQSHFGINDVDLFADALTHLLPRYVSWQHDPNALATDAFSISWTTFQNPLIHPPWGLISRCLAKLREDQVQCATVIVPHWTSAIWYTQLTMLALRPPIILQPQTCIRTLIPGCLSPWESKNWKLAAWQLSGAASRQAAITSPPSPLS